MFTKKSLAVFIGALALAAAETTTVEYPTDAQVEEAAASVVPLSPTSHVRGLAFDRFVNVWIENTVCLLWQLIWWSIANINHRTSRLLPTMRTLPSSQRRAFC